MMRNPLRLRRWTAAAAAIVASMAFATIAFAGGNVAPPRVPTNPMPGLSARPLATTVPLSASGASRVLLPGHCPGINLKGIKPGEKVPLSCLPMLPLRSTSNTATPKATAKGGRFHPLAATGATVDLTAGANCGSTGALYAVGCSLTWEATNNGDWSTTDSYADYQVLPNSTTATLVGTNGYAYNAPTAHTTVLSAQGTYAFFVYDVTKQVIVSIVYANAGQSFSIGVYQDPYHTSASYQFNVNTSSAAYIYLPDVSTNDTYVVYVMSTSVNTYCVYVTPNSTPAPGSPSPMPSGAVSSLLCNPANSPGIAAPSGQLSLTWSLNNGLQAGTYSVVVYERRRARPLARFRSRSPASSSTVSCCTGHRRRRPHRRRPLPRPQRSSPGTARSINRRAASSRTFPNQVSSTSRLTATDPDGQVVYVARRPTQFRARVR